MIMLEIGLEAGKTFLACIILRLQKLSDILQQSSISNTIVSKKICGVKLNDNIICYLFIRKIWLMRDFVSHSFF